MGLPYQRFTDHIIARALLERHLKTDSQKHVRASFARGNPLGDVFAVHEYRAWIFAKPELAEAIILEFPERVKKQIPRGKRELFFHLPKRSQSLPAYMDPFIDGMSWRAIATIDESTDRIVSTLLQPKYQQAYRAMLDALVTVGTKPKHCYSGQRLFRYLSRMTMADRDLAWSEYVRSAGRGSAIERTVAFFAEFNLPEIRSDVAEQAVPLLAACLTTTKRPLRDRATLALVRVGERNPKQIFDFVEYALQFNDPYVGERVLAAVYGVAMSRSWDADTKFNKLLGSVASFLVREMFALNGRFRSSHTLLRGYALGTIELAIHQDTCATDRTVMPFLKPPFPTIEFPFPHAKQIPPSVKRQIDGAIREDFANYTMGRLIPKRANYDMEHAVYKVVKRQIEWRIASLGYRNKRFREVERSIGQSNHHGRRSDGEKTDRYGKKYSWIAYFEMFGWRQSHQLIDPDERCSDCDIDPSFPALAAAELPEYSKVFSRKRLPRNHLRWILNGPVPDYSTLLERGRIADTEGPWILVDNDIAEKCDARGQEVWTYTRAVLLAADDVPKFINEFSKPGFPPYEISSVGESYYTYAGEMGWSRYHGNRSSIGDGEIVYHAAFEEHETLVQRLPLQKAWSRVNFELVLKFRKSKSDAAKSRLSLTLQRHLEEVNAGLSPEDQLTLEDLTWHLPIEDLRNGYRELRQYVAKCGIKVAFLSWQFGWERHHSTINQCTFMTLSPWICSALQLRPRRRSVNLYDPTGRSATVFINGKRRWHDGAKLLYIRRDLLDSYLKRVGKVMLWISWGERQVNHELSREIWDTIHRSKGVDMDARIYKRVIKYQPTSARLSEPKYRLALRINYVYRVINVRFIGTHPQYDKIHVQTI